MLMRTTGLDSGPQGNILLGRLAECDRSRIDPFLERAHFEPGSVLLNDGDAIEALYFPEDMLVSIEGGIDRTHQVEVGLVGREGIVGWSGLLGCARSTHSAVTQIKRGTVLCISIRNMIAACEASSTLRASILRFVEIITVQMAHAIVSHLQDPLERRLSRWLLMRHDRLAFDELLIRHDEIGANLGVRRASVTDALHLLEGERILRCHRGRIIIRDREALEAVACDAYGAPEAHYRQLIGPFGKSVRDHQHVPDTTDTQKITLDIQM